MRRSRSRRLRPARVPFVAHPRGRRGSRPSDGQKSILWRGAPRVRESSRSAGELMAAAGPGDALTITEDPGLVVGPISTARYAAIVIDSGRRGDQPSPTLRARQSCGLVRGPLGYSTDSKTLQTSRFEDVAAGRHRHDAGVTVENLAPSSPCSSARTRELHAGSRGCSSRCVRADSRP